MRRDRKRRQMLIGRALEVGIRSLRDEDIYELLLSYAGVSGEREARSLAVRLYRYLSGFQRLTETSAEELKCVPGMREPQARLMRLTSMICRRAEEQRERAARLSGPGEAGRFLVSRLNSLDHEAAAAVCLDGEFRCVLFRVFARGDAFSAGVEPYDIAAQALRAGSGAVILAHNHVTGGPEPSAEDLTVTDTLLKGLRTAGLVLLDHIIVSGPHYVSLAANGYFREEPGEIRGRYCPDPCGAEENAEVMDRG